MIKVLKRRVEIEETPELEREFRSVRWVYHRLLDFEMEHQAVLDAAAPRLARVGKLLARFKRRNRWRKRAARGAWAPRERKELQDRLVALQKKLKEERNAAPEWKAALSWPNDKASGEKGRKAARRKQGESDEDFAARDMRAYRTRREVYELDLYQQVCAVRKEGAAEGPRCYWASFNAQKVAVKQALKAVLAARKAGQSAQLRRPRWSDPGRISAQASAGGFEILEVNDVPGNPWWTMRMRIADGKWVTFRSPMSHRQKIPEGGSIRVVELCRKRDGNRWAYYVCLTVDAAWEKFECATDGCVGIDTGHRERGHDNEENGLRAFTWYGNDGHQGEVLLPLECRRLLTRAHTLQSMLDKKFEALPEDTPKVGARNRHIYRKRLLALGVRTEAQHYWLKDETWTERQIMRCRKRIQNLRTHTYREAIRKLAHHYQYFAIDVVGKDVQQLQMNEETRHRVRQNRDMVAAYSIKTTCERFGLIDTKVSNKNSTKECPQCGHVAKSGPEILLSCPSCKLTRDQDFGAAYVMMKRGFDASRKLLSKAAK